MIIQGPKGTKDVLPSQAYKWHYVEGKIRDLCSVNGYYEIRTPVFEHTELFERGVGETTDIVQKEMYTFKDKGGRSITLKPEGTAPAVRAFIENNLFNEPQPIKMFYITPCYRYERPQAGRLREFHQFGIEVFGTQSPYVDAEVINVGMTLFQNLGVKNLELRINSVGCPKCRKDYNAKLKAFLEPELQHLCKFCQDRYDTNPLRILDCKEEKCKERLVNVPFMLDNLCDDCRVHFEGLKKGLDIIGLNYIVDPKIVRGLDYYTKTAFEIVSNDIGSQGTVCGGGRYDGLIEMCGGPSTPGVGFGLGLERLLLIMENQGIQIPEQESPDVFIAAVGERADDKALEVLFKLRAASVKAEKDYLGRSLKAQMKYANRINAKTAIVIGDEEIEEDIISIKNMKSGEEVNVSLSDISEIIREIRG
ncbi:histidine--tRNA ligase [Lutispora saccharofermentans]|uniref:Histidine--tRNA ligase n=1 Tax=Lutispora saccharofermentans TaxID=3024236 RepID=A0ABT1NER4_9FIRM|nr:histidine--tRNA ligase [Lutispora saccharofermentans]MCQ1529752.1 histidine--tRNA ligase [Lutispora saccharofermentans]